MAWVESVLWTELSKKKTVAESYKVYSDYLKDEVYNEEPEAHDKKFWKDSLAKIVATNQLSAVPQANREFPEDMPTMTFKDQVKDVGKCWEIGKKRREHLENSLDVGYAAGQGYMGIRRNPLYQAMTERMSNKEMREACRNPEEFSKNLGRQISHYKTASRSQEKRAESQKMVEAMEATGTRTGGNSQKYEAALTAMRQHAKGGRGIDGVFNGVQTVKDYLADKAQVRKTKTGRTRFENCMKFLQQNMPPEEFSQYCEDINRQRGAEDPTHKNHISPEQFAPARSTNDIVKDMQTNVKDGYQMTERDCAVLAASFTMAQPSNLSRDRKPDFSRKADPATLSRTADEIQRNPEFQEWFKTQTPESLNQAVETGKINNIGNYQQDLEKKQQEAAQAEQQKKDAHEQQMQDKLQRKEKLKQKMQQLKESNPEGYKKLFELSKSNPEEYHKQRTEMLSKLPEPKKENPAPQKQEPKAPVKNGGGPEVGGM